MQVQRLHRGHQPRDPDPLHLCGGKVIDAGGQDLSGGAGLRARTDQEASRCQAEVVYLVLLFPVGLNLAF